MQNDHEDDIHVKGTPSDLWGITFLLTICTIVTVILAWEIGKAAFT